MSIFEYLKETFLISILVINLEVGGISGTNFTGKPSESTQALSSRLRSIVDQ